MLTHGATAVGIANIAMDGTVLDTWYPHPELIMDADSHTMPSSSGTNRLGAHRLTPKMLSLVRIDEDRMVEQVAVSTTIRDLSHPPLDAHDVFLRLHLLSHRIVRPHEINMDRVLDLLSTVVWTNKGPCLPDNFEFVRTSLRSRGLIHVYGVDRLPRMVDYVVPSGVRIAEAERVRLGAYLAPGTSVLREGFVSFNSGSLGPTKIEGRMSSGTVIGENTRVGLAATVMAGRSETNPRVPTTIGEDCILGVSAGVIGLDLGDHCSIGNNVVLEPHTPVLFFDGALPQPGASMEHGRWGTAADMAGEHNWTVRCAASAGTIVASQAPQQATPGYNSFS